MIHKIKHRFAKSVIIPVKIVNPYPPTVLYVILPNSDISKTINVSAKIGTSIMVKSYVLHVVDYVKIALINQINVYHVFLIYTDP